MYDAIMFCLFFKTIYAQNSERFDALHISNGTDSQCMILESLVFHLFIVLPKQLPKQLNVMINFFGKIY